MPPAHPSLDLTSFRAALAALQRAVTRSHAAGPQDEELRDACIQRFEYTFELSWKMLKRRLELDLPNAHSVDAMSFRELMRSGGERGLLQDVDAWMVFRDKRNITSHTYNAAKAADVAAVIPAFVQHAQARGVRPTDDIALANLRADLEESTLPWRVDISDANDLPPSLRERIERHGVCLYGQPAAHRVVG